MAGQAGKRDAAAKAKIHSSVVLGHATEMDGFTLKVDLKVEGIKDAFGEMVAIQYAILSLSLVLYLFGKRIRRFTGKFGPMKKAVRALS